MSPRYYNGNLIPASPLGYRTALVPNIYHPLARYNSCSLINPYQPVRPPRFKEEEDEATPQDRLASLKDPNLDCNGDLGWTLEYATAYCYKHLNANRPGVVDAINCARKAPVHPKTPYMLFDLLDRHLFTNKLKDMIFLQWKYQENHSPGVTNAAKNDVKRISIELNKTPFDDPEAQIDELLDMLIHQMIHAYFLVCCGEQKKGTEEDGRLLDGLHFGVILSTIKDITKDCREGPLDLIFYAAHRQGICSRLANRFSQNSRSFIALNPQGSTIGPPPADGHSHCMHDNRRFRGAQIINWQVEHYSRCIDLEMDAKGNQIWDLGVDNEFTCSERTKGPPSSSYVELIWDSKRIMIPRAKVLAIPSLKKPALKDEKHELKIPTCEFQVFKCLWDFLQHKKYADDDDDDDDRFRNSRSDEIRQKGPPIIHPGGNRRAPEKDKNDITTHILVFKCAEALKFPELQKYALDRLYALPVTTDDVVKALTHLYNSADDDEMKGKPVHADLHKWARDFLCHRDDPYSDDAYDDDRWRDRRHYWRRRDRGYARGTSNYEILVRVYGDKFEKLYHVCQPLRDDCALVCAELSHPGLTRGQGGRGMPLPVDSPIADRDLYGDLEALVEEIDELGFVVPPRATRTTLLTEDLFTPGGRYRASRPPRLALPGDAYEDYLQPWDRGGRRR